MASPDSYSDPQEALADIKSLMSRSGRFLSLSGLSGMWAGVCALVAVALAYVKANIQPFSGVDYYTAFYRQYESAEAIEPYVFTNGVITMIFAIIGALFFTMRRSKRTGYALWNSASRSMLVNMAVPLIAGGLLVLAHWYHGDYGYSAAITLIFYGICLLAGGRYTLDEIRYLGYCEIALGLFTAFYPGYGIDAWAIGFGFLHIVYGAMMYFRYERIA